MNQQLILQPVVCMFLLTGSVWAFMYIRRLSFILRNNIDPQSVATPELMNARLPAYINNSSNNLKNLFELPVVFYALCAFLLLSQKVDTVFLYSAWAYAGLRAAHSLVHCTVNVVNLRFTAYFLSSLVLWFMVARLALSVL
ncbi:MAG: MAPEG family protein [bacterium]|nr:MAPEG family protein [bacterium]